MEVRDMTSLLGGERMIGNEALREQLQLIHERQRAAGLEPAPLPTFEEEDEPALTEPGMPAGEPEMYGESVSGALADAVPFSEKKITLPKKKVSFKLKPSANKEAYIVKDTGDMPLADEDDGMTVGSVDSGYVPQFFAGKTEDKA